MAQFWIDEVDSAPSFDAVGSFAGGQVSYAKARLLKPDQAALLQDCEIAITGQVSTRFGTAYIGLAAATGTDTFVRALGWYNGPVTAHELSLGADNSGTPKLAVFKPNGSGAWVILGTAPAQNISALLDTLGSIVQGANEIYFCCGSDIWKIAITAGPTYTYTNLSGDGTTQAPRNASILLWHNSRLVAAGASIKAFSTDTSPVADAIYFSNIIDATNWGSPKSSQQLRVGAGDGQAIIALVPWTGFNLATFKRRGIWVVNADPSLTVADMPIQLVHGTVGCIARNTAVQVGADIFFLADDGVRSLSQVIGSDQRSELAVPLSYPVQDYINRINQGAVSSACATFWRNLYMIALPLDASSTNNFILVYNTLTKSWTGVWTGLPLQCFASRIVSSAAHLMMGLATADRVIEYNDFVLSANWINSTFQDYTGTQVQPRIVTKAYLFDDPIAMKLGMGGEIEWNNSNGTLTVTPVLDENSKTAPPAIDVSSGGFSVPFTPPLSIAPSGLARARFDMMQYGEFREAQFDILGITGGRKELRQLSMAAIIRPAIVGMS